MKRVLDVILIALLLGAAGFGAYLIGHRVDHLSNQASSQDAELQTTTAGSATAAHHGYMIDGTRITPTLVIGAALVVLGALVLVFLINALVKSRRRQRWRLSS
jgi:drug/metabolite transporter (DMT)-like permease